MGRTMSLRRDIERIIKGTPLEKFKVLEEDRGCVLLMGVYRDRTFIVAFMEGDRSRYAKIVLAECTPSSYWHCDYIEYVPQGLYVFRDNLERLINVVLVKLELMSRSPQDICKLIE